MSSKSPRVGVTLMADGDFVSSSAVDNNASLLDGFTSLTQCTSSTRPATPFDGQWIYETDTQNVRRWNAALNVWHLWGGSGTNSSLGYVGSTTNTSAATLTMSSGSGHSQVSLHDYNFTLKNNSKIYKVIEQGWIWLTGSFNNTSYQFNVGLWTNFNIGSNPGLTGANGVHLGYRYISDCQTQQRIPYYKVFYVQTPSGAGTSVCYFRSVMDLNAADFPPSSRVIGRSADSLGSSVSVYDMGALGVIN